MRSSPEAPDAANADTSPDAHSRATRFATWNRQAHYFIGLYFLFFVWLFALTGLLLNHSSWTFAEFWPTRKVTSSEQAFQLAGTGSPLENARELSRQLGLVGEIDWTTTRADPAKLEFRVNRPGTTIDVKADLRAGRATIQRTAVNAWGIAHVLHTFTGVRANDPRRNERDWIVTSAWALAMDAVALGLVLMVISGVIIWWRSRSHRVAGLIALGAGTAVSAVFVVGLRWLVG